MVDHGEHPERKKRIDSVKREELRKERSRVSLNPVPLIRDAVGRTR